MWRFGLSGLGSGRNYYTFQASKCYIFRRYHVSRRDFTVGAVDCVVRTGYIFYRDSTFYFQSSVKMKLLCVQVIKDLIGSEIDVSAVVYLWFPIITAAIAIQLCLPPLFIFFCFSF